MRQDGGNFGVNCGDVGDSNQPIEGVSKCYIARTEPIHELGRILKSPITNTDSGDTHCPDPTGESSTLLRNVATRNSEKALPVRASNWKRRAREAKCDLGLEPLNGDGKKRKTGFETSMEDVDELESISVRKKGRHDQIHEGAFWVPREGFLGGLGLLWRDSDVKILSFSRGHIDSLVTNRGGSEYWRLTGFYGNLIISQ
ncbi:hypothetical protein U1Q18_011889, partial [Sarracenia purpurea var. burkii]